MSARRTRSMRGWRLEVGGWKLEVDSTSGRLRRDERFCRQTINDHWSAARRPFETRDLVRVDGQPLKVGRVARGVDDQIGGLSTIYNVDDLGRGCVPQRVKIALRLGRPVEPARDPRRQVGGVYDGSSVIADSVGSKLRGVADGVARGPPRHV